MGETPVTLNLKNVRLVPEFNEKINPVLFKIALTPRVMTYN